ncbi:NAD(P)/FAD-dependent oxidoreductase [Streptomyces sp. NPDC091416]|uniref:NAD(P)/FAD-dependent oxidoreductase n=1 Tax=Streptomyces sp. NPDC091416 TaxID=3366003 RepID=UPI00382DDD64
MTRTLVVVGHGMVGHRLVREVRALDRTDSWRVVVLAEEPWPAYDRMALSSWFDAPEGRDLTLAPSFGSGDPMVELRTANPVRRIDRTGRTVHCSDGPGIPYDALVLATGSRPFVPPVPGRDAAGCFTYRTLEDLRAIRAVAVAGRPGVVIGGGLLGLEAANALRHLGMRVDIVEAAPRLMPQQVDAEGGGLLASLVGDLGVRVRCAAVTDALESGPDGRVRGVRLADGTVLPAELVVFSAGIRPRDELAGPAGLPLGPRGGFLVDSRLRTEDERVWAIGECAALDGRCHGLVAPGHRMAASVARQLLSLDDRPFTVPTPATRLKVLGVDVASFGDALATTEGALELAQSDHAARSYLKVVLSADASRLLGGILIGDTRTYPDLLARLGRPLPATAPPRLTPDPVAAVPLLAPGPGPAPRTA